MVARSEGLARLKVMRKESRMRTRRAICLIACLWLALGTVALGQTNGPASPELEGRLTAMSVRLRLCLSLTSFAIYSPGLIDLRLHAQQVVNLLEGSGGDHFVASQEGAEEVRGLRRDLTHLVDWFEHSELDRETRIRVSSATKNISLYLELALESSLEALRLRRLDEATREMRKVYAYLAAAYERPGETSHVPGLGSILRYLDLPHAEPDIHSDA